MKLSFALLPFLFAISADAQDPPVGYQPLAHVKEFLQLSDAQVRSISTNNDAYNRWSFEKQGRIQQVQAEIAAETAKENLDPMAIGIRYAEIEAICRDMTDQASTYQKKNATVLTDAQNLKLNVLEEAMKLAPVIAEAQSGNLLGSFQYAPPFFTSSSGSSTVSGIALGAVYGCRSTTGVFGAIISNPFTLTPERTSRPF
jgi:hypothetical protein